MINYKIIGLVVFAVIVLILFGSVFSLDGHSPRARLEGFTAETFQPLNSDGSSRGDTKYNPDYCGWQEAQGIHPLTEENLDEADARQSVIAKYEISGYKNKGAIEDNCACAGMDSCTYYRNIQCQVDQYAYDLKQEGYGDVNVEKYPQVRPGADSMHQSVNYAYVAYATECPSGMKKQPVYAQNALCEQVIIHYECVDDGTPESPGEPPSKDRGIFYRLFDIIKSWFSDLNIKVNGGVKV